MVAPSLNEFVPHAFEDVIIQYLRRQNHAEKLSFHFTQIGRWWTKTDELDVVATEPTKKSI